MSLLRSVSPQNCDTVWNDGCSYRPSSTFRNSDILSSASHTFDMTKYVRNSAGVGSTGLSVIPGCQNDL